MKHLFLFFPAMAFILAVAKPTGVGIPTLTTSDTTISKLDTLKTLVVLLGTPRSGDGKNGDNSHLKLTLTLTTKDGKSYVAKGAVGDHTEIGPGYIGPFPPDISGIKGFITRDNIAKINLVVEYDKPDWGTGIGGSFDKWNVRAEVVLTFKDSRVLATGYTDPATQLTFAKAPQNWSPFGPGVLRNKFFDHQTMAQPVD